ncbi:MAG TPA: hypothetical protein VHZ07_25315 [Bryobacteraceae bacterium]|nr:hypothetical protein [Bryobacteraceae bacterium]
MIRSLKQTHGFFAGVYGAKDIGDRRFRACGRLTPGGIGPYGALGFVNHLGRDGAKQHAANGAVTMRAHHDQVDVVFRSPTRNGPAGIAFGDQPLNTVFGNLNSIVLQTLLRNFEECAEALRTNQRRIAGTVPSGGNFEYVKQCDTRAKVVRHALYLRVEIPGSPRKIDWEQNVLEFHFFYPKLPSTKTNASK